MQAFDEQGNVVWQTDYDIYGNLRNLKGDRNFIPFRQLGQIEDEDIELYLNGFRYYDYHTGLYISQDPIRLAGNNPTMYGYVHDNNSRVDVFGLSDCLKKAEKTQWGWTGTKSWNEMVSEVNNGGTIKELKGKVPTRNEAIRLIEESGGTIVRIEGAYPLPNPHKFPHINLSFG